MEIIKKQFRLIPNKNIYMCIMLTSTVKDLGFFDGVSLYDYSYYYNISDGMGLDNLL